ncbi:hypothetical protein BCR32DRAFT_202002 [Anaeromyces robustus]|uniref:Uncharacterized protein n=1 Tax=Anaeromyces robustus TaxID=1754192 RepID=A0A1Y1XD13_9FUNG|nr:hypothetical protein BCR32DRAFT_202002 [Anaeromyces robustus]|eukprot:ORX83264.1 hypothetical protein BCR32DRAFT_202002 [Anaeromyces robustus]
MKVSFFASLLLAVAGLTTAFDTSKKNSCIDSKKIVGYFSEWRNSNYPISRVDLSKITHLNYAFGLIDPSTYAVTGYESWILTQVVEAAHKQGVKVLMSIGGWYGSRYFTKMTSSKSNMERFADSCKNLIDTYKIDGIDIDWEYPGREGACNTPDLANDTDNYLTLLEILRKKIGNDSLITAAVSAIPFEKNGQPVSNLSAYAKYFDFINLMAYDFAGSWSSVTSHHSGLYDPEAGDKLSVSTGVKNWLNAQFPASKIVVGVPAYGNWIAASSDKNGLYQSIANKSPKGDQDDSNDAWTNYCGVVESTYSSNWKYKNLRKEILTSDYTSASGSWVRTWDDTVMAPYLFNKDTKQIISYDDPKAIENKAKYVLSNNFAGMMVWELENDTEDFEILSAINKHLGCDGSFNGDSNKPTTTTTKKTTTVTKKSTTTTTKKSTPTDTNCPNLGYPCCNDCRVVYQDEYNWGVLNNQW